jgi:hypothetical protein
VNRYENQSYSATVVDRAMTDCCFNGLVSGPGNLGPTDYESEIRRLSKCR